MRLCVPPGTEKNVFGYDEYPGFGQFPKSETEVAFNGKLILNSSSTSNSVDLADLKFAFPKVQTFPNGDILIASARCHRWKDGSFELNARVYKADGTVGADFCLGDGLEHLAIDASGRIWAGYSDEGVYGNYGWGQGAETDPIGAWGLKCFDQRGSSIWEYKPLPTLDPISDCYLLNCAEDAIWACYYTGFPIVRISSEFQIKAWETDLSGPRQMAIEGDRLLVYGGYGDKATDCWLLQLGDKVAERIAPVRLLLPGEPAIAKATVIGRGRFLHVFVGAHWYSFQVPHG